MAMMSLWKMRGLEATAMHADFDDDRACLATRKVHQPREGGTGQDGREDHRRNACAEAREVLHDRGPVLNKKEDGQEDERREGYT